MLTDEDGEVDGLVQHRRQPGVAEEHHPGDHGGQEVREDVDLGSGRIAASETEVPNILAIPV